MDPQRFRLMAEVFEAAWQAAPSDRAALIQNACGGDVDLSSRVHSLLRHYEDSGDALRTDWLARAASDPAVGGDLSAVRAARPEKPAGTVGDSPDDAAETGRPTMIDRYELLERLGEGGFGTVYRARQLSPVVREVALKVIKPGMDTRQIIARFQAERQALAVMDHPGIARVFDAGATAAGRPYFVMELVRGVPITRYASDQRLDLRARLGLLVPVCQAVQHAHQKGIIHRDLKPSNVLVVEQDGRPTPKVIDFGIAKAAQQPDRSDSLMTLEGQFVGTPAYMSPEQADLRSADIDTRSDIYAIGVLMYEMLSGTTPFPAGDFARSGLAELLRCVREVEPKPPSTHAVSLRGELDWIIMKCLEKDRGRRYQSASALADDIERHLRDEPVLAGPPSRLYRFRKLVRRNRALFTAGAAIVVLLVTAIVGTGYGLLKARRQRDEAVAARTSEAQQRELADQRRAEAEKQTRTTNAVTRFLTLDLLGAELKPGAQRDERISDVLARAEQQIDAGAFRDEPGVETAVRSVLSSLYGRLGRLDEAERHARRSLELIRAEPAADRADIVICLNNLGQARFNTGHFVEAEESFRQALELVRTTTGMNEDVVAGTCSNYSELLRAVGRLDESERLVREGLAALDAADTQAPSITQARGRLLAGLGELARVRGDFAAAITAADQALESFQRALGDEHPLIASVLNNKGLAHKLQGNLAAARPYYEQALAMRRKLLPADSPDVAISLNNLAALLRDSHDFAEAEPLYREALNAMERSLPPGHFQHALVRRSLGGCLVRLGRFVDAEREIQSAYDQLSATPGLPPQHVTQTVEAFIILYDSWAKAEPDSEAAAKAAAWRAKLPASRPASRPG